ncbi:P-loop containing nucleoside triphosphate hydrolase protein [Tricladium varicosporioides]|nr:P-loop containing nucleoside triphosphate hydrolase protein [Hymenoscyphus varicosporioides]
MPFPELKNTYGDLNDSKYEGASHESENDSGSSTFGDEDEDTEAEGSDLDIDKAHFSTAFKSEVKCLYDHSYSTSRSEPIWSEKRDLILEKARLKKLVAPFAIIHRFSKSKGNKKSRPWDTHSIEIQSLALKAFLDTIFEDYDGWNSDTNPYTFWPPFPQFLHRWDKLKMTSVRLQDKALQIEVEKLIHLLIPFFASPIAALEEIKTSLQVRFKDLWLIFPPGEIIITHIQGKICACKLRRFTNHSPEYVTLEMEQIDWNGSYCGFKLIKLNISKYSEKKLVSKLVAYPIRFALNEQEIREELIARGRQFESLRGFHVRKCIGEKYATVSETKSEVEGIPGPISGRVVIDTYAFYLCQNLLPLRLTPLNPDNPPYASSSNKIQKLKERHSPASEDRKEDMQLLSDLECMLTVPHVRGFDLKTKEWCKFNIDELHDPDWSDTAYDKLVLAESEKELIMVLANSGRLSGGLFKGFTQSQDRGINFLLSGPPGVGKTLTAEAVADKSKSPLYVLGANDIGTSVEKLEKALDSAFKCCHLWNAVLLLDEADVFLEARSSGNLNRNELVSVFLRRIEYYQGIMFLTTNRSDLIDEAFQSRMDLILRYTPLDEPARRQVWKNFLDMLDEGVCNIEESDIGELAQSELNGREIKNMIKTAYICASREGILTMNHLRTVLNVRKQLQY